MRSPLLVPALACVVLGAVLVLALRELWWPAPWPLPEEMELAEPVLPVSSQGTPTQQSDMVVVLQHKAPKGASCSQDRCEAAEHWFARVRAGGVVEEVPPYLAPLSQCSILREQLRVASERCPKETQFPFLSQATLSIRAASTAPFSVVRRLISEVAQTGIYRIEFAVTAAQAKAEERRVDVTLPSDAHAPSLPLTEVWISLQWDRAAGAVVRRLEESRGGLVDMDITPEDIAELEFRPDEEPPTRREKPPTKPPAKPVDQPVVKQEFPGDAAGDAELRSFLRGWLADPVRQGSKKLSGVVDKADDVPFQTVVDLIDAFRAAGIVQIKFVAHKPK